jgi:hypothetical protein
VRSRCKGRGAREVSESRSARSGDAGSRAGTEESGVAMMRYAEVCLSPEGESRAPSLVAERVLPSLTRSEPYRCPYCPVVPVYGSGASPLGLR